MGDPVAVHPVAPAIPLVGNPVTRTRLRPSPSRRQGGHGLSVAATIPRRLDGAW